MPEIVTNALYAEIDRLTAQIKELTQSRDEWKREWRLLNAGMNMAEDKVKELEIERDEARGQIKKLEAVVDELDHIAVTMCKQKNKLEAENKRLAEIKQALRADMMDLYEAIAKKGEWDSFDNYSWNYRKGASVNLAHAAWLFCLDGEGYESRCQMVVDWVKEASND